VPSTNSNPNRLSFLCKVPKILGSSAFIVGLACVFGHTVSAQNRDVTHSSPAERAAGLVTPVKATSVPARVTVAKAGRVIKTSAAAGDTIADISRRWNVAQEVVARLNGLPSDVELEAGREILIPAPPSVRAAKRRKTNDGDENPQPQQNANRLTLTDRTVISAIEVWEEPHGYWYRRDGVAHFVARDRVKRFERASLQAEPGVDTADSGALPVADETQAAQNQQHVLVILVGGAKVEADEVTETALGAWYRRGNITIFVEKSRIERIEREPLEVARTNGGKGRWTEHGWTTGNTRIDNLIRHNGVRFGVDPYLIFCVMEQESHFNSRAVSPVGARGLMQLMPGTAARFGVRRSFDPAENIMGGTRYLKLLLGRFGGKVNLVLAGYNAGEGAVAKYGGRVPPYRETRSYVKRISNRYDRAKPRVAEQGSAKPGAGAAMR
jgi:LysM repeat protein